MGVRQVLDTSGSFSGYPCRALRVPSKKIEAYIFHAFNCSGMTFLACSLATSRSAARGPPRVSLRSRNRLSSRRSASISMFHFLPFSVEFAIHLFVFAASC